MNINGIDWKIVYARISAVTLVFAAGGTLSHVIPGRPGLIVTTAAGIINVLLPRIQKDAGIVAAIKQYFAASKAQRAQKRQAVLKDAVDDLLKTGYYVVTKDGIKAASEVAAEDAVVKEEVAADVPQDAGSTDAKDGAAV